jgi:hypothetical protein
MPKASGRSYLMQGVGKTLATAATRFVTWSRRKTLSQCIRTAVCSAASRGWIRVSRRQSRSVKSQPLKRQSSSYGVDTGTNGVGHISGTIVQP